MRSEWDTNGLTQLMLLDSFRIQHHPLGTPGTSAFFLSELDGRALAALGESLDTNRQYLLPETLDPNTRYKVVLQKLVALHPEKDFSNAPEIIDVDFASKAWKVLDDYTRQRTAQCRFVDTEKLLPGCLGSPLSKFIASAMSRVGFDAFQIGDVR